MALEYKRLLIEFLGHMCFDFGRESEQGSAKFVKRSDTLCVVPIHHKTIFKIPHRAVTLVLADMDLKLPQSILDSRLQLIHI